MTNPPFKRLIRDQNQLFWALQLAGWTGYFLAAWLGALAHEKPPTYALVLLGTTFTGLLITTLMRHIYRWLWTRPMPVLFTFTVLISYAAALPWKWASNELYYWLVKDGWTPTHLLDRIGGVTGAFYVLMCWTGLYFGIKWYRELQDQTERTLKATSAAHQAQLKMLRYQLNPHFLFNTLNTVSAIMSDDLKGARRVIARLSEILRINLDSSNRQTVPLRKEMELLGLYLDIEKERFGDRLEIDIDVSEEILDCEVPHFILQPLVENALKHGLSATESGGRIGISGTREGDIVTLQVRDNGRGLDGEPEYGVGLTNTRERLRKLYGEKSYLRVSGIEGGGTLAELSVPCPVGNERSE